MINANELKVAVELIDLVPLRSGIPSSNLVGISLSDEGIGLRLSAGDIWAEGFAGKRGNDIAGEPASVNRGALISFVGAGDDGDYTIKKEKERIILLQGKRKAVLQLADTGFGFGQDGVEEKGKSLGLSLSEGLRNALACARLCASEDLVLPEINCIWIEPGKKTFVFSSNDVSLCFASCESEWKESAAFPLPLTDALPKLDAGKLIRKGRVFGVKTDAGYLWAQAPEKAWESFPAERVKNLVVAARKKGGGFTIPVSQFAGTIQTFGGYLAGSNKADGELRLEGKKGRVLNVGAKNAFAEFADVSDADVNEQVSLSLGLTELAKVMDFLKDQVESVVLTPVGKVAHVRAGDFEFLFSIRPSK